VLKRGTSPSLLFQKFSRWYKAYCGVERKSRLGLFGSMTMMVMDQSQDFGIWSVETSSLEYISAAIAPRAAAMETLMPLLVVVAR